MPTVVQHDQGRNQLHLIWRDDLLITKTEWFAPNAYIELAADNTAVGITFCEYYTAKSWTLTEAHVGQYHLEEHLDDLRLVFSAFFAPPDFSIKRIENEHGIIWDAAHPEGG